MERERDGERERRRERERVRKRKDSKTQRETEKYRQVGIERWEERRNSDSMMSTNGEKLSIHTVPQQTAHFQR